MSPGAHVLNLEYDSLLQSVRFLEQITVYSLPVGRSHAASYIGNTDVEWSTVGLRVVTF